MQHQFDYTRAGEEAARQKRPGGRTPDIQLPEESYYVNRHVFSRLTPSDIPQPKGKVYRG